MSVVGNIELEQHSPQGNAEFQTGMVDTGETQAETKLKRLSESLLPADF